ncbi:MAG: hypothetical protein HC875_35710 [Anaerolineales bacterium]|nr:hypothetical protein [Anaerolineales bacterium]
MTITDALATVRYVSDTKGDKTDVLVPLPVWEALLGSWNQLIELLEDQEDRAILQEWLQKRADGEIEMISLESLEQELVADGLLPG